MHEEEEGVGLFGGGGEREVGHFWGKRGIKKLPE